jgi:hypothetical protein
MTDDMIKALAQKGGVMQVNFYCNFISQKSADAPKDHPVRATLAYVVAHIDHIKQIAILVVRLSCLCWLRWFAPRLRFGIGPSPYCAHTCGIS